MCQSCSETIIQLILLSSMYWCFSICIVVVTIILPGGSKKIKAHADKKTEKIQ